MAVTIDTFYSEQYLEGARPSIPSNPIGVIEPVLNPPGVPIGHSPVTIGTPANGLSINDTSQVLSLGLSSASTIGALSSTDWSAFNAKIGGTIASGQVAFGTGVDTIGGDSGLTWDNVNKRLSVFTSQQLKLRFETTSAAGNNYFDFRSAGGVQGQIGFLGGSTDNFSIINVKNAIMSFGVNNSIKWTIQTNGNLVSLGAQTVQTNLGELRLATGAGNSNILITPNGTGNVLIGNLASPTNTLDVNGTTRIRTIDNLGTTPTEVLVPSATGVVSKRTLAELGTDLGAVLTTGDQTIAGIKTFTTQVSVTGSFLSLSSLPDNRSKIRLFGTSFEWGIGTQSASTFGRLNDTAVTFNVPNTDARGWLWGDSGHTLPSQGSMSLTSNGNLTVANSLRLGYGESDTDDVVAYGFDHNGTARLAGIPSGTIVDTLGLDVNNQVVKGAGGGGISGLTTNRIPKATSATTIGDSRLFDDGTSAYFSNQGTSTFFGNEAGNSSDLLGRQQTAFGSFAAASNISSNGWAAFGYQAGQSNTSGNNWTAIGNGAGSLNLNGSFWTAIGSGSGDANTSGSQWTAVGHNAGGSNVDKSFWTAIGSGSGGNNTGGSSWTSIGVSAGGQSTTGSLWVAIGQSAGLFNTTGNDWVALGSFAGYSNASGSDWIAIGYESARYYSGTSDPASSFSNGVYIGQLTKVGVVGATNEIVIGHNAEGIGSNTVVLGNTSIIKTVLRGTINAANLPTSSAGLLTGDIWNDAGTLKIV